MYIPIVSIHTIFNIHIDMAILVRNLLKMLRELVGLLGACFKKLLAQPAFWSATERVWFTNTLSISYLHTCGSRNVFRNGYDVERNRILCAGFSI